MLKTRKQVIAEFHAAGISIAEWSRKHGFDRSLVYSVLNGGRRALRGRSHDIAVSLGIKKGNLRTPPEAPGAAAHP